MRTRRATIALAAIAAAFIIPAVATPAAAARGSCGTTGASGSMTFDWSGKYRMNNLELRVKDTLADGHHVAIRLVTLRSDGSSKYWDWHRNYKGAEITSVWFTYAYDTGGITKALIEVARFEGSQLLNLCGGGYVDNPN
ncbi:hypothetical protein H9Y04_17115 [Streptomyces sp. TRM66268-LWL]|uniref:Secreted protein n=1 Tax=Streptomyces polyasparticus TaxID=2767826 RepID=A0ABR7SIY8_9ACTN|nr:hypothetical protein [Streptomyces polyasparticus]MBC9714283.1 hypothetical protein [Streptomyces polyasparticus]